MAFRNLYFSCLVAFTMIGAVWAESPVAIPDVHKGDVWKYHSIDGFTNETTLEFSHRIVDLNDREIIIQLQNNGKSDQALRFYNREWNSLDLGDTKFTPFYPDLRFPISIGNVWRQEFKSSNTKGQSYSSFVTGKVATLEQVTVPAGTFDAYKVEKEIEAISTDADANTSKAHITTWYAPAVKKYIRRETTTFSNGRMRSKSVDELVEYSFGKNP